LSTRTTKLGGTDWSDGEVLYAADLNDTLESFPVIAEIYTGNGFDSTGVGSSNNYELTAITASELGQSTYLKICVSFQASAESNTADVCSVQMKIQTKEIGGAYGDSLAYVELLKSTVFPADNHNVKSAGTFVWFHTLTTGEKSNGVQVKMFSQTVGADSGSFTNKITSIEKY